MEEAWICLAEAEQRDTPRYLLDELETVFTHELAAYEATHRSLHRHAHQETPQVERSGEEPSST
jgi:hypothetical protein